MKNKTIFFTHGNLIIYLEVLLTCILFTRKVVFKWPNTRFHCNEISRDCIKVVNGNHKDRKMRIRCLFPFSKISKLASNSLRVKVLDSIAYMILNSSKRRNQGAYIYMVFELTVLNLCNRLKLLGLDFLETCHSIGSGFLSKLKDMPIL
ncbi:hypothetical protein K501DRAFT_272732 [Backusella circina FSU 941]|nr:hypothetical protein K501DRAFT_272732 [Backusella circina FSU 941]